MTQNIRGIKWCVLLTKNLSGEIVDGLGSGAWKRTDGRKTICNVVSFAKKSLERENVFQNIYIGFRLVIGDIGNNTEVYRYISKDLEKEYDKKHSYPFKDEDNNIQIQNENGYLETSESYISAFDRMNFRMSDLDKLERKITSLRKDGYLVSMGDKNSWKF